MNVTAVVKIIKLALSGKAVFMMFSIDEVETMLDEISEELPKECYKGLNGGILLLPEIKTHPKSKADDLYVMGEYHNSSDMGKYIVIYYGSFAKVYGHLPAYAVREKLKKTLCHEFIHHIETLAGECGLEIKDAENLAKYLRANDD